MAQPYETWNRKRDEWVERAFGRVHHRNVSRLHLLVHYALPYQNGRGYARELPMSHMSCSWIHMKREQHYATFLYRKERMRESGALTWIPRAKTARLVLACVSCSSPARAPCLNSMFAFHVFRVFIFIFDSFPSTKGGGIHGESALRSNITR